MSIGFIFPGQGSQQVGMGSDFLQHHPVAKTTFEEANDRLGFDLQKLCLEGPEEDLTLTAHAQPAILTVSTIAYRLLAERVNVTPVALSGHSLGEYSALVAAGVMAFGDAVVAVNQRGKAMQVATPVGVGAMAAILGMGAEELEGLCEEAAQGDVVAPANYNCPGQIVISGHKGAVERVLEKAKGKALPVSAPFHSSLMQPAADAMAEVLGAMTLNNASAPVITNAENAQLTQAADVVPSLVRQITAPVRWDSGIAVMQQMGVTTFVELGHGKVLAGLNRRIDKTLVTHNVFDEASLTQTAESL